MLFFSASACSANNLKVQNVSLEKRRVLTQTDSVTVLTLVEFDVSWDNSWRHAENHDAAWLIFKASIAGSSTLAHCTVYPDSSSNNLGNTVGTNKELEFKYQDDQMGVFLRRAASGYGVTSTTNARVTVDCGATAAQSIAVTVIGIEMVYIPTGEFYVGDGGSYAGFVKHTSGADPWFIESDLAITTTSAVTGSYYYVSAGNPLEYASGTVFTIPRVFPKGYSAFYCMKYPVTEGQWVEFFNSIGSAAQATRDITSSTGKASDSVIKRNTVSWGGSGSATTSREDRAMSYISWEDLAAYLDWVALRPMSELEYEKVARGPVAALRGEYAWGSTVIYSGVTFAGSPEDGNTVFVSANIANTVYNLTSYTQGDAILGAEFTQGPVRPGIFASETSRERSGAGYYGVMDLSGNLFERVATVGNSYGTSFYPVNGDGTLNTAVAGAARQLGWPGTHQIGRYGVFNGANGSGGRGGSWSNIWTYLRTSDRTWAAYAYTPRDNFMGGRGVRWESTAATLPECGDSTVTAPEQCDDGMHCHLGTLNSCASESDCDDVPGQVCGPMDGDGCSSYCECEDCGCAGLC